MNIKLIKESVSLVEVRELARELYGDMVKGVVDVEREVIALGGEWHMDANTVLLAEGSLQENVWGFNVHVDEQGDAAVTFVSLINIRPRQGNRSMELQNTQLQDAIRGIIRRLIPGLFV